MLNNFFMIEHDNLFNFTIQQGKLEITIWLIVKLGVLTIKYYKHRLNLKSVE